MAGKGVFKDILDGDVFKYYGDGEWKRSSSGQSVSISNPATRKPLFRVQGTSKLWNTLGATASLKQGRSSVIDLNYRFLELFNLCTAHS